MGGGGSEMPRGSHLSLRSILFVAAGLIAGGSSGILLASLSGLSSASLFLQRAYHSYEQLALVSQLESDILVLLLEEEQGAAERDVPLSPAGARAQDIERTLAVYLASIRSELESRRGTGEADGAAGELEQALALRDLFRAMLGDLGRTGEKPGRSGDGIRPAIAAQRTADLRARVHRIVEGERAEVAEAIEAMAATRSRFQRWAIVIGAAAVGGLLAMLLYLSIGVEL